jgi:hypothetical protein
MRLSNLGPGVVVAVADTENGIILADWGFWLFLILR